ncbi:MAG: hypothetical protein GY754_46805 [bacterium]|nr:hypothetical protein [bacterium]
MELSDCAIRNNTIDCGSEIFTPAAINGPGAEYNANISVDISDHFFNTTANNYHFLTTPDNELYQNPNGGLNGILEGGSFDRDRNGNLRPATGKWTIGAVEVN